MASLGSPSAPNVKVTVQWWFLSSAAFPGLRGESGEGVRPRDPLTAISEKEGD